MRKENPCRYCVPPERYLGCHDRCPKRAEWLAEYQLEKDARRKYIDEEVEMSTYMEGARRRMRLNRK